MPKVSTTLQHDHFWGLLCARLKSCIFHSTGTIAAGALSASEHVLVCPERGGWRVQKKGSEHKLCVKSFECPILWEPFLFGNSVFSVYWEEKCGLVSGSFCVCMLWTYRDGCSWVLLHNLFTHPCLWIIWHQVQERPALAVKNSTSELSQSFCVVLNKSRWRLSRFLMK